MNKDNTKSPIELFRWIWISYLKTAIIPLVLVEMVFIGIYFLTNNWSQKETIDFLKEEVNKELKQIAELESSEIKYQLLGISNTTQMYKTQTEKSLIKPALIDNEDLNRLKYSKEGVYYTFKDRKEGGAAIFYSGYVPIGEKERNKVTNVLTTQELMKDIKNSNPLVASIYFNTFDSLNIIYPYFDVISQYPHHMDIPTYNFYYEADKKNNPQKSVKWTDAYLDPAGHGWMTSSIAPVYNGEFLEGVVGIDVTINTITNQILKMDIPWDGYGMLVSKDGTILALPEKGEKEWGLKELTNHHYSEAIMKDTFKPDEFNIYKNENIKDLGLKVEKNNSGAAEIVLNNSKNIVRWATIEETGWKLLLIVPQANVYEKVNAISKKLFNIGNFMIAGLIVFYILFFIVLSKQARKMSLNISTELLFIDKIVHKIGQGDYYQRVPDLKVKELENTAIDIINMGNQLGKTNEDLLKIQGELKKREFDLELLVKSETTAREDAQKANKAKSQFLSSMSHELRTPLNAILGFAQILEIDPRSPLNETQASSVKEIFKAGTHLLALINEVLDLSRIESGKILISIEPVQISRIMEEVAAIINPLSQKNNIKFTADTKCCEKFILADQTRIKQVLINLLSNAVKYNKKDGEVIFNCEKVDEFIRFNIIDNGIGIKEEDLNMIFKPFYRINNYNSNIEGTGIGLTVAKQLVELMNGKIFVSSNEGVGSHFWVELPFVEENNKIIENDNIQSIINDSINNDISYKLLYIEDNPANLRLVENIMTHIENVKMISSYSGEEGIVLARKHIPDIILLDINLPGIDGYEVFRQLKKYEETKDVPVIAVSANAMEKDIERSIQLGFKDYITKPIDVSNFIKKITSLLSR